MSSITSLIRFRTAGIVSAVISLREKWFDGSPGLPDAFVAGSGPTSSNVNVERQLI